MTSETCKTDSRAIFYYVPGWLRTGRGDAETWRSFMSTFPDARYVRWSNWGGNDTWPKSLRNSELTWPRLADELSAKTDAERSRITLVGHSLGARIIIRALAELSRRGKKVQRAILMGAAIPNDDLDLAVMGQGCEAPVLAVCNPLDVTLKYFYNTVGGEPGNAFGTDGAVVQLGNVKEVAVRSNITDETDIEAAWGKLKVAKRLASHHALFYLSALRQILTGEQSENGAPLVPQGEVNLKLRVMDAGIWWDVLESAEGWKLERNKITGHCRILDSAGSRVAWGREVLMRKSFAKVIETLRDKAQKMDGGNP